MLDCCTSLLGLSPHPESVPINLLVRVEGTPLAEIEPLDPFIMVRTIATARILMPASKVRLSAGRRSLTRECCRALFPGGSKFHFRRREASDYAQPRS